jgi:hypothetical protein
MYKLSIYSTLSLIIIKGLRKDKTQLEMSISLQKKYNVYHRWESGEQRIKLKDFLQILEVLNIDIKGTFLRAYNFKYTTHDNLLKTFLKKHQILNTKVILKYLQISDTSWWRMINSNRDIFLDEFLLLANYKTQRTNIFIQELGMEVKSNLIKTLNSTIEKYFLTYINNPELSVIGAAIYLKSVRLKSTRELKIIQIAKSSGYSVSHSKKIITNLVHNKILFWDNSENLDFNYFENSFSTTREQEVFNSLKNFLIKHLNKKIHTELLDNEKFHFRVAPVSNQASLLISQEIKICASNISDIISNDDPLKRTKIIAFISTQLDM